MMKNAWRIARKDLRLIVRDRRALLTLLAMPTVFIAILGLSTGRMLGWRNENESLKLVIVNLDASDLSKRVVDELGHRDGVSVVLETDPSTARKRVHDGDSTAAVVITAGFFASIDSLTVHQVMDTEHGPLLGPLNDLGIQLETDSSMASAAGLVEFIVRGVTARAVLPFVLRKNPLLAHFMPVEHATTTDSAKTPDSTETVGSSASKATPKPQAKSDYGSVVYQKIVPAYTVMFTFFLVTIMARSFIVERELGTLRRLRTLPVRHASLLIGKTIPFAIVSVSQGCLLFIAGRLLFGMSWGSSPWMLLPVIVTTSLAATGLGLLTATLVRTEAQVSSFGTLVVITMAGISGCFMPREWLPEMMRHVSLATPHAWSLIAYDQLLATATPDFMRVWQSCLTLTAFALSFIVLAWLRFRAIVD
jgi:ABC-2 type transport system permease protein